MPTTLIILAHPEQKSFNAAWANESARQSEACGHEVLWSDLCAMGFDPVEGPQHYSDPLSPFDPLKAQEQAAEAELLPDDVTAEIDKIKQADRLIFHFPIWWFGPPAILKGWCERTLTHGGLHTVDQRFDAGLCRDKKSLFCVTTGSKAAESNFDGKEGDVQMLLWPLAYTLRYLGMTVLKPKLIHGVHGYFRGDAERTLETRLKSSLSDHKQTIADFDTLPEIPFNSDTEFDEGGRLKSDAPIHSLFIRHKR
ncbi:MAG: NAD(P)H-dependent oxidoreductase [Roseibium sp.]